MLESMFRVQSVRVAGVAHRLGVQKILRRFSYPSISPRPRKVEIVRKKMKENRRVKSYFKRSEFP